MKSIVALGGLHFGSLVNREDASKILTLGIDHGLDLIDTAPLYGNSFSEEIIGKYISKVPNRPQIATKVGLIAITNKSGQFGVTNEKLIKKNIEASVNKSLKNLGFDQIDILTLHAFDKTTPMEETVFALNDLIKLGKVKSLSCSNFNPWQLKELIKCCHNNKIPINSAQVHYNLIERRAEGRFIQICEKHRMQLHVNRSLARGALSSKYIEGIPRCSRAYVSPRIQKWLTPERTDIIKKLNTICKKYGVSLVEASVMWFKCKNTDIRLIVGARSPEQLKEIIIASALETNTELINDIESYLRSFRSIALSPPKYLEK
jgi:aryl-alcohol dehydrogenase-like predicted oxidoreductase